MPRLVATDLDGTIVRSDGSISDRTRAALASVEQAGAVLVLVTGRPPRWMPPIAAALEHRGLCICANGAVVYDLHTEQVVETFLLAADTAQRVAAALRSGIPGTVFAAEHHERSFTHEPAYVPRWDSADARSTVDFDDLLVQDVVKMMARHPELGPDDFLAAASELVGEDCTLTHSSSDGMLEISAVGVSKATGLALLAGQAGLDAADVVAFGDMPNDLPMLAWAGRSYAVANAHPQVLAAAGEVVPSNDDDGVAATLARWF